AGIDVLLFFENSFPSWHSRSFVSNLRFLFLGCRRRRFRRATAAGHATFRAFRSIFGTTSPASIYSQRVQRSAHDVITHARQTFPASASHEHDGVLLQIMPLARNIGNHFLAIRQSHLCHFAQRRVRLLRRARHHLHAHTAPLRTTDQRR